MDTKEMVLARGLTHLIFRNGAVESLHAEEAPLTDDAMKQLNKDVYNRIYSLLTMDPEKVEQLAALHGMLYGDSWDAPEVVDFGVEELEE